MGGERPESATPRRIAALSVVVLAIVGVAAVGVAAPVSAGDSVSIIDIGAPDDPRSDEIDVSAGDTVDVDVLVISDGGYDGRGLDHIEFAVEYDADVVTVTDVEAHGWMAGGGADVDREIETENGRIAVSETRLVDGEDDEGATGNAPIVTLTIDVAEDAPPSNVKLDVVEGQGRLVSGYPLRTFNRDGYLIVDSGGEEIAPGNVGDEGDDGDEADSSDDETAAGVTTADDIDREVDVDDGETGHTNDDEHNDEASDSTPDSVPGFGIGAALLSLGTGLVAARRIES